MGHVRAGGARRRGWLTTESIRHDAHMASPSRPATPAGIAALLHPRIHDEPADQAVFLARLRADPMHLTDGGRTTLHVAAALGHAAAASEAITAGVDPRAVDDDGNTAAHVAAMHGYMGVIDAACHAGCPSDTPRRDGRRPIDLAAGACYAGAVAMCIHHGAMGIGLDHDGAVFVRTVAAMEIDGGRPDHDGCFAAAAWICGCIADGAPDPGTPPPTDPAARRRILAAIASAPTEPWTMSALAALGDAP